MLVFFALSVLAGCGGSSPRPRPANAAPIVWPLPPEKTRIRFLRAISTSEDVAGEKGFWSRIWDFIAGTSVEGIIKPYGVTVDSSGRLLVADTGFRRVHVFDLKKNKYDFFDNADREGDTKLKTPISVAVDADDNVYVSDSTYQKVFVYDRKGDFLYPIDAGEKPTGVAVNKKSKRLYIVDTGSHSVGIYDLKGRNIKNFGTLGAEDANFNFPVDVSLDKNGDVYVIDAMNYRVKIFDADGNLKTVFGRQGDGTGDFGRPKGIAVDNDGNIYVADALFDTVQVFDRQGRFLLNFGSIGSADGAFWIPCGLYMQNGNMLFAADAYNRRVQVFEYQGGN